MSVQWSYQVLIPVGLILIGGSLIYWAQYLMGEIVNIWVLPWLFGALVAGGYVGWVIVSPGPLWLRIIFVVIGCVCGVFLGVIGFITDPEIRGDALEQYTTTLFLFSMPVGVVLGTLFGLKGSAIGFFLGPLLLLLLWGLIAAPSKIFSRLVRGLRP